MLKELLHDAEMCHRRRFPSLRPTPLSLAFVMLRSPGFLVSLAQRTSRAYARLQPAGPLQLLLKVIWSPYVHLLVHLAKVVAKTEVYSFTAVEAGVSFPDGGHLILGAKSIGSGTVINERVTIGRRLGDSGNPEIGRDVWIGEHCVIYGDIKIGAGAKLLPYTVISRSVPAGVVVQGNPARVARQAEAVSAVSP